MPADFDPYTIWQRVFNPQEIACIVGPMTLRHAAVKAACDEFGAYRREYDRTRVADELTLFDLSGSKTMPVDSWLRTAWLGGNAMAAGCHLNNLTQS